jgi:hypothetical protein
LSTVNEALDGEVIKQLGESKKIRDFQKGIQSRIEAEDGSYNDLNYQDAMQNADYYKYMNGGTESLKSFNYVPYVDKNREVLARMKEAKEVIGEQEMDVENPDGSITRKKVSNFTISQFIDYIPNLISPEVKAQIEVEARAMYNWDDETAKQEYTQAKNNSISPYQSKIEEINALMMSKELSLKEEKELKIEKGNYQKAIDKINGNFDVQGVTAQSLGYAQIYNKLVLDNAALAGSDPSRTLRNLSGSKTNAVSEAEKRQGAMDSNMFRKSAMALESFEEVSLATKEKARQDKVVSVDAWKNRSQEDIRNKYPEQYAGFDSNVQAYIESNEGVTQKEAEIATILDIYKKNHDIERILEADTELNALELENQVAEQASKTFIEGDLFTQNSEGLFKASFTENAANSSVMVTKEDGTELTSRAYLIENEVETKEDFDKFLADEQRSKTYKANIFADFVVQSIDDYGGEITKEFRHNFERLNKVMGTNNSIEDFFEFQKIGEGQSGLLSEATGSGYRRNLTEVKNKNSTLGKLIEKRRTHINKNLAKDDNFFNDNFISSTFDYNSSSYQEGYNTALSQAKISVETPQKITVTAATDTKGDASPYRLDLEAAAADLLSNGVFEYDSRKSANIFVDPKDPSKIIVSQIYVKEKEEKESGGWKRLNERNTVSVDRSQFNQLAPNIAQIFDLEDTKLGIKTRVDKKQDYTNISFLNGEDRETFEKYADYFQNSELVTRAFKGENQKLMRLKYKDVYENNRYNGLVIDRAIENSDRFKVELKTVKEGKAFVKVYLNTNPNAKKEEDKNYELFFDTGNLGVGNTLEETRNILALTPQVFVSKAIEKAAFDFRRNGYEAFEGDAFNKLLTNFSTNER